MINDRKKKLRKLLAEIAPEEKQELLTRNLEEEIKEISARLGTIKDPSGTLTELYNQIIELKRFVTDNLIELSKDDPQIESVRSLYSELEKSVKSFNESLSKTSKSTELHEKSIKEFNERLEDLKIELMNIPRGGGSMNQQIRVNGTIATSRYADINIIASGATVADNNTEKRTDITLLSGGTPGGSNTQVQYNNAGAFGGITGATTDGTALTLVAPILGTPASATLTNATGLPLTTGVTGLLPLVNAGWGIASTITAITTNGNITAMPIATNIIRYAPTSTTNIQGIANNGTSQRITLHVQGVGLTLIHESASAIAANRLSLTDNADFLIPAGKSVELFYDTSSSRWRLAEFKSPIATFNTTTTQTLFSTMSGPFTGTNSVVFGNEAVSVSTPAANTSVIIGYRGGRSINGTVSNLTSIGSTNFAVVTGTNNTGVGNNIANLLTTGTANFFGGVNLATSATTASNVIGLGSGLAALTTGTSIIAIGNSAGVNITSGSNIIAIGTSSGVDTGQGAITNGIAIGNSVRLTASNQCLIGGTSSPVLVGINVVTPAYRLDVGGDINISSGSSYRINGVAIDFNGFWSESGNSLSGSEFLGSTNFADLLLKTNNTTVGTIKAQGITGFQKTSPTATGHFGVVAGTVGAPTNFSSGIGGLTAAGGYGFGSGDKNYTVRSLITVSGTTVYSSATLGGTFTDPGSGVLNPSSGSANSTPGSGYDPNVDTPPTYEVWSLFTGDTTQGGSTGSFQTDGGTWIDTSQNQNVNVSWSGSSLGGESNYYVLRNGTDFRVVGGPFTDDNTGWAAGGAPGNPAPNYTVSLSWTGANGAESYNAFNTTTTKWTNTGSASATDDGTWTAGTPSSTPTTADYDTLHSDGNNRFEKKFVEYNNVTTTGWGIPAIYASGRSTAQTAAVASVTAYTVGSADGSFEVSANVLVTTSTNHNFTVTCAYTDEGNTARTLTMTFGLVAGGVATTAIANANGAVPYHGVPLHIRCKASTAITIATTGTFTTVTYNVEGSIKQIA